MTIKRMNFCFIQTCFFLQNSDSIREKMKKNYLSNPGYNYDQINRASLACGPMVKWAIAQVKPNYFNMNTAHTWGSAPLS